MSHEFDVEDVEYLRHGARGLLATTFVPRGKGPFPCIVELHGGSWAMYDRTRNRPMHETLARNGIAVAALDFRYGPDHKAPASAADANYGVRWVKANAAKLRTRPDMVGISGNSNGGHSALMVGMCPRDPHFASIPLAGGHGASLRCVVLLWPVACPLGRYHNALSAQKRPEVPTWAGRVQKNHEDYFGTEAAMERESAIRMLEKGAKVELPPVLWIQSSQEEVHNYPDPTGEYRTQADRFADCYRKDGGQVDLRFYDAPVSFTTVKPDLPESIDSLERIVQFVQRHIPQPS